MKPKPSLARRVLNGIRSFFIRENPANANFQAAGINRLTQSWTQTTLSADAQARSDLKVVRARSRQLRDNNDYAKGFVTLLKTNVLGDGGIHFRSGVKDPDLVKNGELVPGKKDVFANKVIEEQFYRWTRKQFCTVTGKHSLCDLQNIVLESVAVDGELLIRKVRTSKEQNPFGFTLQLLESDYLDDSYDGWTEAGNEVRMGIEIDRWGKTVAYHLLTQNPNDTFFYRKTGEKRYRLPASEVIYLGIGNRPNQTRCMPWLATPAYRLNMVGKYEEAEVTAARAAACKMGFLIPKEDPSAQYEGDDDGYGNKMMDAEPGALEQLPAGMDLKALDWQHPNSSYQIVIKTALRGVASSLGVSYNSLANDMESVNFASGKLGLDFERRVWKRIQYWLIESFLEEVFEAWLEAAIEANQVPLPITKFDKFNAPVFRGPRWPYVNPMQEVSADSMMLKNRLTSVSRILAERNIDRDELFQEIEEDMKAAEAHGFKLMELDQETESEIMIEAAKASAANDLAASPDDTEPA